MYVILTPGSDELCDFKQYNMVDFIQQQQNYAVTGENCNILKIILFFSLNKTYYLLAPRIYILED